MSAQVTAMLQLLLQVLQMGVSSQQPPSIAMALQPIICALPTVQQHSRTFSTASSMPPNTGVTQASSLDPVLSQSLPPPPTALQQRILRGEYIDFNTLLS